MRHAVIVLASLFLTLSTPAHADQISYKAIDFSGEQHGSTGANGPWTQLGFVVSDIRISGACYSGCILKFTLDRNQYSDSRAHIGIKQGLAETVTSEFPAFDPNSSPPYAFIGGGTVGNGAALRRSIENFRPEEKLILAWIAVNSAELIDLALASGKMGVQTGSDWTVRRESFERSVRRSLTFLNTELVQAEATMPLATDEALSIQADLAALKLYAGAIDGVPGAQTRRAITQFQRDTARLVTGALDPVERDLLARAANRNPALAALPQPSSPNSALVVLLRQEIANRNTQIFELNRQAQLKAAERDAIRTTAANLARDISTANRTIAELKAAATVTVTADKPVQQPAASTADLQRQLSAANATIATNRDAIDRMRQELSEVPAVKTAATALGEEIAELKRQLAAANATIANERDNTDTARQNLAEASDVEAKNAALKAEIGELERQLAAANATIANERDTVETTRQKLAALGEVEAKTVTLDAEIVELGRQLAAANSTIADLQDGAARDEKVVELERKLGAANATIADNLAKIAAIDAELSAIPELKNASTALKVELEQLQRQLTAANQTVANLRDEIQQDFTPNAEMAEVERQLAAANGTLADLRASLIADYVSKADYSTAKEQISALNRTNADLQQKIISDYVPRNEHLATTSQLARQLAALNQSILEVQERNESQKRRLIEAEGLFINFREDCRSSPSCAKEMQLE